MDRILAGQGAMIARADQELRWQVSFCRDASFPEKR